MATTPRGDDMATRRAVIAGLARRIAAQRTGAGINSRPVPLRPTRRLTATPMPTRQGAPPGRI